MALYIPTQSESYLLPSHTVLPAADASAMGRNTHVPPSSTVDPQGGITIMDEKVSSKHMREKSGPGTRQPWEVLNAK